MRGLRCLSYSLAVLIGVALSLTVTISHPRPAEAHLATFGSWELTKKYLLELFPEATTFLKRQDSYTPEQVKKIEADLGFSLYPEDKNPEFYIAIDESGAERRLLGVAIFIDPRVQSRLLEATIVRMEVGIGVDARGKIYRVRLYDYRGDRKLTQPAFLDQFVGLSLEDDFKVGKNEKIKPVASEPEESQLVANAAREALYLMKVSLGR
ncbi:MAG: hypothetical protein ACNA8W_13250 [Bradymonadaceae bacterium]